MNKCHAHKTALTAKDLALEYPEIQAMNQTVYKIVSYFHTKKKLDLLNLNY